MASSSASGSGSSRASDGASNNGHTSSARGAVGDASRNRGHKINTLPSPSVSPLRNRPASDSSYTAWAKSFQDDDALFSDSSQSPLTSRAHPVRDPESSVSPCLPQPPARAAQLDRTQRHADTIAPPPFLSASEHTHSFGKPHLGHHTHDEPNSEERAEPGRPSAGPRRGSVDFWAGKWADWRPNRGKDQPTTPGGGVNLGAVNEKAEEESRGGAAPQQQQEPSGDWWQFTLPVKYRRKVEDYWRSKDRGSGGPTTNNDPEKALVAPEGTTSDANVGGGQQENGSATMRQRAPFSAGSGPNGYPFSMNFPLTPGWAHPWSPAGRTRSRLAGDPGSPGPDMFSELDRRDINRPSSLRSDNGPSHTVVGRFRNFLLHHYAAPLVLRVCNLVFSTATLALAARIRVVETGASYFGTDLVGVVGSSTTFALIISPPSLVYIMIAVYAEYFGPPLGVWRVSSKMIFTLLELIMISLWSALVALALDDEFTTPLECTSYTPNSLFRGDPLDPSQVSASTATVLCDLQAGEVAMVMTAILLYAAVLVVMLFRIFMKVSYFPLRLVFKLALTILLCAKVSRKN